MNLLHLANFIRQHGNHIVRITDQGVVAAVHVTQRIGNLEIAYSEFSKPLSTLKAAKNWLGY